jgi:choline/carnitine/betaine transport
VREKTGKERLQEKNFKKFGFNLNLEVTILSGIIVMMFIFFTILMPEVSSTFFKNVNVSIMKNFSWLYVFTINVCFLFLLYLALSKFGDIRLGGYNTKPEFNNFSWYAMLFSAGIGIGIFFYGVAEPIYFLDLPEGLSSGSIFDNFKMMYLHWGIHAWAVYAMIAVGMGYFAYDKKLPFSLRSLFYPLLHDKIYGFWGNLIDTIAVISVLFGLATSLGLGARQINAGLSYVFNIPYSTRIQVGLIILITIFATMSVVSGISKGIRLLSKINTFISGTLLLIILIIGPTSQIFSTYVSSMGLYIGDFFKTSTYIATDEVGMAWQSNWTIFYWAWWISWTPFVGTFIAQISKGRTIREIAVGTVVVPTIIITFAMTILGATGVYENAINNGAIATAINSNISTAMFEMFTYLTSSHVLRMILSLIAIIAIMFFFITSSDSGSLVVDNLTSGGLEHSPNTQRVFWAVMEGLIALSVLLLGGEKALVTMQSAVIITALPFSILLLIVIYSLKKELRVRHKKTEIYSILKLRQKMKKIPEEGEFKVIGGKIILNENIE